MTGFDRKCGVCFKEFRSTSKALGYKRLQGHINRVHGGNRKYFDALEIENRKRGSIFLP